MAKPVTHLSKISHRPGVTVTGTLCNRMSNAGNDINCTDIETEVTCKFCIKQLRHWNPKEAA